MNSNEVEAIVANIMMKFLQSERDAAQELQLSGSYISTNSDVFRLRHDLAEKQIEKFKARLGSGTKA